MLLGTKQWMRETKGFFLLLFHSGCDQNYKQMHPPDRVPQWWILCEFSWSESLILFTLCSALLLVKRTHRPAANDTDRVTRQRCNLLDFYRAMAVWLNRSEHFLEHLFQLLVSMTVNQRETVEQMCTNWFYLHWQIQSSSIIWPTIHKVQGTDRHVWSQREERQCFLQGNQLRLKIIS